MIVACGVGPEYVADTLALRVHICHSRRKIEPAVGVPHRILTEPGVGFAWRPTEPSMSVSPQLARTKTTT